MTSPRFDKAEVAAGSPGGRDMPERLRRRSDFLRLARAKRAVTPGFVLQARNRRDDLPTMRVGFTCSKKVGGAVDRNRAKRRLREIARLDLPGAGRPGWDYVLIGRRDITAARPFDTLRDEFRAALAQLHGAET